MRYGNLILTIFLLTISIGLRAGMLFDDDEKEVEISFKLAGSLLGYAAACNSPAQEDLIFQALKEYNKDEKVLKRFSELKINYFVSVLKAQSDLREAGLLSGSEKAYRLTCKKINDTTLPHFKACIYGRNIKNCSVPDFLDLF